MKKFLMVAVLMVSALAMNAQDYNWAIGVRGGLSRNAGLTVKKGMGGTALDFTANWYLVGEHSALNVQGLYEWQQNITGGLDWYYGLGAHVGLNNAYESPLWLGVDAVIGLEFKFPELPIAISLDYRPGFDVLPATSPAYSDVALGLKFCF